ncbi:hypothetical protein AWV79_14220 [Cupriavidus sp. UYMMa02A]|nr:hypothetical protein AWV79_14220 [Cupriavidus sp. UYMMa02A]
MGCIGVILDLTTPLSLFEVHSQDGGSQLDDERNRLCQQEAIAVQDLERTITQRAADSHNEWVIADYRTVGILAMPPFDFAVPVRPTDIPGAPEKSYLMGTDELQDLDQLKSLAAVQARFPDQPLYTMTRLGFERVLAAGNTEPVTHAEFYPI